jgi:peroxiredoxin
MTDERFLRGFRAFDMAVAPDAAFADRLFRELADELRFEPGVATAPTPTLGTRHRRTFRLDWRPLPPVTMRLVYLAATLALLLVALAAAAFVGSQLLRAHPSPLDLVRQSQAAVAHPPAFVLGYRNASGAESTFSYDGEGTWRSDDADGSYGLWDGTRQGYYNASSRTWGVAEDPVTSPPFILLMDMWGWASVNVPEAEGALSPVDCADATWVEGATVAHRTADHVRCPSWDTDYWIDRESHLVLKFLAGPTTPGWIGDAPDVVIRGMEAVTLDLGPPKAAAFSWDGPIGAYDENNPPPSTVLALGAPVPGISATTVDGATIRLPASDRPTAVLFTTNWGGGRAGRMYEAFGAAAAAHPGVSAAIVLNEMDGTVAGYRDLHPITVPLVGDWDGTVSSGWGITVLSTLVLIDAEGIPGLLTYDEISAADLGALLGALEAGTPLPEVAPVTPAPTPSFVPPPSEAPIGATLPAWMGPLAGGGSFDAASLAGRPYVLASFARSECETCEVDYQLDGFKVAEAALGDRAAFVLLGNGEATSGTTARQMTRHGIDVPVVMDWDGTVSALIDDALQNYMASTIVVDADGRLAAAFEQFPGEAAIAEVLDRLEAAATPAP